METILKKLTDNDINEIVAREGVKIFVKNIFFRKLTEYQDKPDKASDMSKELLVELHSEFDKIAVIACDEVMQQLENLKKAKIAQQEKHNA